MAQTNPITFHGHSIFEVASAFQKAFRRGLEQDALHWGVELELSGYGEYAWKRMRIILSEDIGLANPTLPATIHALYETYQFLKKKGDEKNKPERLQFIHAILLLVRSPKSRIVDHALICAYENHKKIDIPEYAYCKHTLQGKRMGRGFDHFFKEAAKLNNEADLPDLYRDEAREILIEKEGRAKTDKDSQLFNVDEFTNEVE